MTDTVISVENLGKRYFIGAKEELPKTKGEALRNLFSAPFKYLHSKVKEPNPEETFWALKDVSFEVKQGEVVGLIGRNGAGKSTLLKILSRITKPSSGCVKIRGRVGSLLEVGTGFHPELTGRENIYLNGTILGMTKREIDEKFDEIVDFAEVEKFLDTPVKRYSSGMYVRLAFAVAAHLEPEILVVDEVLAVGDAAFQKKCMGKMEDISKKDGKTIILVSHSMASISKLCTQALLLRQGLLCFCGNVNTAIRQYISSGINTNSDISNLNSDKRLVKPKEIMIIDAWMERDEVRTNTFLFNDQAKIILKLKVFTSVFFSVEIILRDQQNLPIAFAPGGLSQDCNFLGESDSELEITCHLPILRLAEGKYYIDLMLAEAGVKFFDYLESALTFFIDRTAISNKNWAFTQNQGQGCILWDVNYQR